MRQELRALLMATLVDGNLAYIGAVELGLEGVRPAELDQLARRQPSRAASRRSGWSRSCFCVVRFAGWRPSGTWRVPVVARWENTLGGAN